MSDIEKQVREIARECGGAGAWPMLEFLGYFVGVLSLPVGLLMILSSVIIPAVKENQDLAEAKMPDSWLNDVAKAPGISDKGLAFLARQVKRNGSASAKDALKFLEIEKAERETAESAAAADRSRSETGAQALLRRAKDQGGSLLDDAAEVATRGVKIVSSLTAGKTHFVAKTLKAK